MERWAVASLRKGLKECSEFSGAFGEADLRLWVADMIRCRVAPQTRKRYFGKLSSLYTLYSGTSDARRMFSPLMEVVGGSVVVEPDVAAANFSVLRGMLRQYVGFSNSQKFYADIFLYLFYNGGLPVESVVKARFEDLRPACPQIDRIVASMEAPRRKFVFALEQGRRSDRRIAAELSRTLESIFAQHGFVFTNQAFSQNVASLWVAAAEQCGVGLEDIRSVVGCIPLDRPYLQVVLPRDLSREEREAIICRVADHIDDFSPKWFVMKLRRGVTPDRIMACLEEHAPELAERLTTFYPCREIVQRVGKKRVANQEAFIPDLLFFRIRELEVPEMFRHIGGLAWCYRQNNTPDSPYCSIPPAQMKAFQFCIGRFTSDMEIELVDSGVSYIGRKVRITGGDMAGYEGILSDVVAPDGSKSLKRMFRIRLSVCSAIRWTVDIEEHFIEELAC